MDKLMFFLFIGLLDPPFFPKRVTDQCRPHTNFDFQLIYFDLEVGVPEETHNIKLADPANLRVCCDGTYRMTREDYAIITLGLISKTRARGKQPSWLDRGFCTQFHEMVIGLVRKEAQNSYTDLMNGFVTAILLCCVVCMLCCVVCIRLRRVV